MPKHRPLAILRVSAAVDIGVDNLAEITANKAGFVPRLVNGRSPKSTNQFYNKRRAELQAALGHPGTSQRQERLTLRRTRRINAYLRQASKAIIALLGAEGIGSGRVGKNPGWKEASRAREGDQPAFCPDSACSLHSDAGVQGAAFGHLRSPRGERATPAEPASSTVIPSPPTTRSRRARTSWSGKRVKRGLYQARDGRRLTADVNGSDTILHKAVPDAFGQG